MDLKVTLNSIIPDNIKRIPLIEKSVNVFSEMLQRNSIISYRINKIFDVDNTEWITKDELGNIVQLDPKEIEQLKYIEDAKENLKLGLFYTYLSVMFRLLGSLYKDFEIFDKIKLRNLTESNLLKEPYNTVNSEYLNAFRYFQTSSGTEQAIRYMYQFSRYLETGYIDNNLELNSENPFFLQYKGELHKVIFSKFNMPMAHPCGWCFIYDTIARFVLEDYFGIKFTYNVKTIKLQIGTTSIYFGELPEGISTNNVVRERAIRTVEEKLQYPVIHVISDRTPHSSGQHLHVVNLEIVDVVIEDNDIMFVFDTGNVLLVDRETKKTTIKFSSRETIFTDSAYTFPKRTLYVTNEIPRDYEFEYKDVFVMEETLEPSGGKAYVYKNNFKNAFKLIGDTYPFCPGVDESRHKVTNNSNLYNKFTCTINYRSNNITYLRIEDDFGHNKTEVRDSKISKESDWTFKTCTHGFYGDYLTFRAYDGKSYNYDHYVRTNLMNRFDSSVKISGFSLEGSKIKFTARSSNSSLSVTVKIGSNTITRQSGPLLNFELDTSSYSESEYKIKITDFNDTVEIEGSGLNSTSYTFQFSFPEYPTNTIIKPQFINCNPDTMSPEPEGKDLGDLNETPTLKWNNDTILEDPYYIKPDRIVYVSELNPTNHKGLVYINRGFEKVRVDSSDSINTSSTKYVDDEFYCETSGSNTWIQFTNPVQDGSLGKYLVCRYNNDPQTDVVRGMLRGHILTFK